jgi:hypothetical protein
MELAQEIIPVVLATIGAALLFNEVRLAQKVERLIAEAAFLNAELQPVREMEKLYRTDKREFVIRAVVEASHRSRAEVESFFRGADAAMIEAEVAKHHALWTSAPQSLARFEATLKYLHEYVAQTTLRQRAWLLRAGFAFLLMSAAFEVAVSVSRH